MLIRPQRDEDTAAVRAVTARAFAAEPFVADLVEALAAGPARLSLVAEADDGAIVGHTTLSRGWIDAAQRLVEAWVLSPLSVDPPVQRQGIGGALVRAALAAAGELEVPAVFLEGSPDYYPRFGFEAGTTRGFARPSVRIPQCAFQVVVLPAWEPWMTGALVYPDAFWLMDAVGLRDTG
ncbi:MAG TPA: GNAT family N-acetyltransferase [Jatrophihabitantaceae bacterium]|jgi:putative acetyltransferase|nr:GNAT family N-acetyltransferase [Jatrophihabitantaceae bacterium]